MRKSTAFLLIALIVNLAVAGAIEVFTPHPAPGECQFCWVYHGLGTQQDLDNYKFIGLPVASALICLWVLLMRLAKENGVMP